MEHLKKGEETFILYDDCKGSKSMSHEHVNLFLGVDISTADFNEE